MIIKPHELPEAPPASIVSLVPSQTELLYDLQLEHAVTGITKFCIHPTHFKQQKIIVGGTKQVHLDKVAACKPDLVIANKEENVKEQVEALARSYPVLVTDVNNLQDALTMIEHIGLYTGRAAIAQDLCSRIAAAFSTIRQPARRLRCCYLIWRDPYMTVGGDTFIHDMLQRMGLDNIFAHQARYPAVEIADIKAAGCEVLLLSSEPYPFREKHLLELRLQLPGTQVQLVDGEMFSWYGSRLLPAAAYLSQLQRSVLHTDQ